MKVFKSIISATWLLMVLCFLVRCADSDQSKEKGSFSVAVTQIATHPGIEEVRRGFLAGLEEEGFKEGENVGVEYSNANGDFSVAQAIAQRLAESDSDLIFAISTPSTQAVLQALEKAGSDTPVVFGAITDPVSAGIVDSLTEPTGNVTGTTDFWPIEEQFQLMRQVLGTVRRVGVIYNPSESNSVASMRGVRAVTNESGIELIEQSVTSSTEVPAAARSLVGRVDALYIPADNTVISALPAIVRISEEHDLPLLPGDTSNVEVGGFGTVGHDYFSVGVESGLMAAEILRGAKPGDLPVRSSSAHKLYFNMASAERMEVSIPEELLESADVIYHAKEE